MISFEQAHLVATAFLDARRSQPTGLVEVAYRQLAIQADRWFARLTGSGAITPIRVVYTRCPEPYASGSELAARVRADRLLEIWPSAYDRERPHPVLDTTIGGTYDRFRAVHDIVSHAWRGLGFDRHGEFAAWLNEHHLYSGLARWALATELHAEHSVRWTMDRVAEHRATLLDASVLQGSFELGTAREQPRPRDNLGRVERLARTSVGVSKSRGEQFGVVARQLDVPRSLLEWHRPGLDQSDELSESDVMVGAVDRRLLEVDRIDPHDVDDVRLMADTGQLPPRG